LLAVATYLVLLGDRALGFYALLQDGQFNAGNVAAVCFLAAGLFFVRGKLWPTATLLGAAGVMHLNYALVGAGLWGVIAIWSWWRGEASFKSLAGPTVAAWLPCLANIGLALPAKLQASGGMPLGEFLDLYVFFRHAHHYAPSTWPALVWIAFLVPLPLAMIVIWSRRAEPVVRRGGLLLCVLLGLQVFALLTAGLFYVGESFVQLSLWRVSPHAKLLAVTFAAVWLSKWRLVRSFAMWAFAVVLAITIVAAAYASRPDSALAGQVQIVLAFGVGLFLLSLTAVAHAFGGRAGKGFDAMVCVVVSGMLAMQLAVAFTTGLPLPGQSPPRQEVLVAAAWAREKSPGDAVFLLPPGSGSAFPLHARRSHVVSYKLVPQLSGELATWRDRLSDVVAADDLLAFVDDLSAYKRAQQAMDEAYGERSLAALVEVARSYDATHIVRYGPADVAAAAASGATIHVAGDGVTIYELSVP
ncbi:MAG: DUF6798 domain-containing protein, partial [Planctomycetota bacterium]